MVNVFQRKRFRKRIIVLLISIVILVVLFVKYTAHSETISNYITDFKAFNNMREENERLRNTLENYKQLSARKYSLEREKEELQSITVATKELENHSFFVATVIQRNYENWYESIIVNKGKNDNIELNMTVITATEGLIGRITEVNDNTSVVTLITSDRNTNHISAMIQNDHQINGIVKAQNTDEGSLELELESNYKIESGDVIVTSDISRYPEGIKVGTVTDVEKDKFGLIQIASLQPAANFYNINYVIIIGS